MKKKRISFPDEIVIQLDSDSHHAVFKKSFRILLKGGERKLTIPVGFETDFASSPQIFWNIVPPMGKYTKAAVLHDYLYYIGVFGKGYADEVFLEAMEVLGCSYWRRYAMYWAVRGFGGGAWKEHRDKGHKLSNAENKESIYSS